MACLVACRVARVAETFAGPLKSFLSELLQIDVSRITIFSFSLARRLRGNLRRLMANLAVDYSVQVENTKVEEVVTEIVSGNTTRRPSAAVDWGAMFKSACCFGFQPWSSLFDAGSPCFTNQEKWAAGDFARGSSSDEHYSWSSGRSGDTNISGEDRPNWPNWQGCYGFGIASSSCRWSCGNNLRPLPLWMCGDGSLDSLEKEAQPAQQLANHSWPLGRWRSKSAH